MHPDFGVLGHQYNTCCDHPRLLGRGNPLRHIEDSSLVGSRGPPTTNHNSRPTSLRGRRMFGVTMANQGLSDRWGAFGGRMALSG